MNEEGDVNRNTCHQQDDLMSPGSVVIGPALWELSAKVAGALKFWPLPGLGHAERGSVDLLFSCSTAEALVELPRSEVCL